MPLQKMIKLLWIGINQFNESPKLISYWDGIIATSETPWIYRERSKYY